ncbi:hypothetical protein PIROE2DRAFT_5035 [Piromyces sp. E2]|nr:hypothetical protein PIROE2DRAFT_5035 [Piromyces sp. E2]|eukprot:OUM67507.1 hypothetical protein PIROE2DRAFT_5035 [Piromyces sp. E2]
MVSKTLKKKQKEEEEEEFSDLPTHYLEISSVLLDCASDDIPYSDEIKILLKDIREIRKRKTKKGLELLNSNYIQQSVFTPAEIEFISEYEQITILPLQRMEAITLLEGTYGPFRPPITIKLYY